VSAESIEIRLSLERAAFRLQVDLRLPSKGITVLYGPSGCGKTTLLRCVAGLERGHAALVRVREAVWQDDAHNIFLPPWQRPIGYVFQESSLFDHLNVADNLAYGIKRCGHGQGGSAQAHLQNAITLLGISHLLNRRTHGLSGGERQRVAIARALAMQPSMLLLDEPLAAIDHAKRQEILPWLERLRDEVHIPMLYVTHAVDEVARLADTLVVMRDGAVLAHGPAQQVLSNIHTPLALGDDLGALLDGRVEEIDAQWHLAAVRFAGDCLWLRDSGLRLGQRVRLRVLARDVSITTTKPDNTSIQNLLPCNILALAPDVHPSQVLVQLGCGESVLLARITARAADALKLAQGQQVWAQVKSVALVE
jgi:molybdate transport system ATP-binding protein